MPTLSRLRKSIYPRARLVLTTAKRRAGKTQARTRSLRLASIRFISFELVSLWRWPSHRCGLGSGNRRQEERTADPCTSPLSSSARANRCQRRLPPTRRTGKACKKAFAAQTLQRLPSSGQRNAADSRHRSPMRMLQQPDQANDFRPTSHIMLLIEDEVDNPDRKRPRQSCLRNPWPQNSTRFAPTYTSRCLKMPGGKKTTIFPRR